jgi:hypothetical protein
MSGVYSINGVFLGTVSGLPQNSQSTAYTFALSDNGAHVLHPAADTTARIWTIPANATTSFPIGTTILIVNEHLAGTLTIQIDTTNGDTLRREGTGTTSSLTLTADGMCTLLKIGAQKWYASGGSNLT